MRANQPLQQNNGRFRGAQQTFFQNGDFALGLDGFQRREHQRERFFFPMLSLAQAPDRQIVAGVNQQMESAQPFEGDDVSIPDSLGGGD